MLNQLKLFFEQHIALPNPELSSQQNIQLACAALFIEMMSMDDKKQREEHEIILGRVKTMFSLSLDQATTLISLASEQSQQSTDYFQFTSLINQTYSQQQKITLIKTLWQIAYADGYLEENEEYMVRKIADLLHVPHIQFIKTKIQVNGG
ncbi:MAG: TerB family tellurite resistance protein [Methylococcaceae bacterium]|nr:TerB family tellurite resistance protein [Methylococcaceae bacterium]